jgi:hypothetical protein
VRALADCRRLRRTGGRVGDLGLPEVGGSALSGRERFGGGHPGRCPGLSHSAPLGPQQRGRGWVDQAWVGGSGVGGWGCVRGWVWDGLGCNGPNGARGDSPGQSPGVIRRIVRALKGRDGVCPVVRCEPWGIAGACGAQAAGSEIGALPRATSSGPWGRCHTR